MSSETTATPELKSYTGSCHCGARKFSVTTEGELTKAGTCTCSICSKKAALWATVKSYTIAEGSKPPASYQFNDKKADHQFCDECATPLACVIPAYNLTVVNARAINDLDWKKLATHSFDGAAMPPVYAPPAYTGPEITPGEGEKVYNGSCHCGAITLKVRTKPLAEVEVKECDCTICTKNSYVLAYPDRDQVGMGISPATPDALKEYMFGPKTLAHQFCGVCGVPVGIRVIGPGQEFVDKLSDAGKATVEKKLRTVPINLHTLYDVEWSQLNIKKD